MSLANPRWGAPRIHGELLKLGIQVSQATVAKYMVRHRKPPSQSWRTFLKNHAKEDRKSTRLNSSHSQISYAVFCLKKKKKTYFKRRKPTTTYHSLPTHTEFAH